MHYYKFNIGDYKSHTEHLDPLEDIAYRRMIDYCYLHEKGLPKATDEIARLICMRTHCECINIVLHEFFVFNKVSQSWENKRILEDVEIYKSKSDKARKSAEARWSKDNDDANALRTDSEGNANHKPLTTNHKPLTKVQKHTSKAQALNVPYDEIVSLYHEKLLNNPQIAKLTDSRKRQIKARWNNGMGDIDSWARYFDLVSESKFLTGQAPPGKGRTKPYVADIDFLIKESSVLKIVEGKYT